MLLGAPQCLRQRRECRPIARRRKQNPKPPVKIRQLREGITCLTRRSNLLRERAMLLFHCIQQEMMQMTLRANGSHILLQGGTRIDKCRRIFPETIVGIGEVAAVPGQQPRLLHAPLHQGEIALVLCANTAR